MQRAEKVNVFWAAAITSYKLWQQLRLIVLGEEREKEAIKNILVDS